MVVAGCQYKLVVFEIKHCAVVVDESDCGATTEKTGAPMIARVTKIRGHDCYRSSLKES